MSYLFYDECDRDTVAKLKAGEDHGILVHSVKVLLTQEADGWFAQGLEVNLFAQGTSEQAVKDNFADTLEWAIEENLNRHGHLGFLTLAAPPEAWAAWKTSSRKDQFSCLYKLTIEEEKNAMASNEVLKNPVLSFIEFEKRESVHA